MTKESLKEMREDATKLSHEKLAEILDGLDHVGVDGIMTIGTMIAKTGRRHAENPDPKE